MENSSELEPEEAMSPVPPAPPQPHHVTRRERRKRKKLILFIAGGAVLALLLLGALYWFFLKDSDNKRATATSTSEQQQAQATPVPEPADPTPVVFKSTKYNIELTYRKDWKFKEASSGEITITSPSVSYTRSDGKATTGVFTFKMRVGIPETMKATIEKSVAARDSEVIAYDDPPETQRYYTNLSYAGQKDIFNFFIVTGNTALKTSNSFAYTLALDGDFYLLAGGYGTDKDSTLSFDSVSPSAIDSEVVQQAVAIVKSLKIF